MSGLTEAGQPHCRLHIVGWEENYKDDDPECFRMPVGFFNDPRFAGLTSDQRVIWLELLGNASQRGGWVSGYSIEEIATKLPDVHQALTLFAERRLVAFEKLEPCVAEVRVLPPHRRFWAQHPMAGLRPTVLLVAAFVLHESGWESSGGDRVKIDLREMEECLCLTVPEISEALNKLAQRGLVEFFPDSRGHS